MMRGWWMSMCIGGIYHWRCYNWIDFLSLGSGSVRMISCACSTHSILHCNGYWSQKMVICSEEQDFNLMWMEGKSLFSSLSREMLTFSRLNVHGRISPPRYKRKLDWSRMIHYGFSRVDCWVLICFKIPYTYHSQHCTAKAILMTPCSPHSSEWDIHWW